MNKIIVDEENLLSLFSKNAQRNKKNYTPEISNIKIATMKILFIIFNYIFHSI